MLSFLIAGMLYQVAPWVTFESEEGRFLVMTPVELIEKVNKTTTAIGEVSYHSFFYQDKDPEADILFYIVSYVDYPEGTMNMDSTALIKEFFETTIAGSVESVQGDLRYQDDINLDNYPGKFWRVDYEEGETIIKTRAYLVNDRYYSIQTICDKKKVMEMTSDRFMDSFRLKK